MQKKLYVYGIKNMVQDNESSTYKVIKIMRKKVLMVCLGLNICLSIIFNR